MMRRIRREPSIKTKLAQATLWKGDKARSRISKQNAARVITFAHQRLCAVGGFLHRGLCDPVMAVVVGSGHDTVGCQGAVPARIAVPRILTGPRRVAVLDSQPVCRLAADRRSAVADLLAAAFRTCGARSE